jgi:hypothetical protein
MIRETAAYRIPPMIEKRPSGDRKSTPGRGISMLSIIVILIGALSPAPLTSRYSQPSTVTITVLDAGARYPLSNADVINLENGQHRFTDEHGQVTLPWPATRTFAIRVRELGYQPIERTLRLGAISEDATTFALSRVAYVIPAVKSTSHCATAADSASLALSVTVLDQLRQGAEKYNEFRRLYPFEMHIERRTASVPPSGRISKYYVSHEIYRSEDEGTGYRPGDIVQYKRGDFLVPILILPNLADTVFWDHHCFIAEGVEQYLGARAFRLDFAPSSDVTGPDWEGSAFIDSATSLLRRIDFRLVHPPGRSGPRRLEGYTTFSSPSPYIIIPDTTGASWWMRSRDDKNGWGEPDFAQVLFIEELTYKKAKPPT